MENNRSVYQVIIDKNNPPEEPAISLETILKWRNTTMREILFRGKCLDNGKWIYGDLSIPFSEWNCPTIIYPKNSQNPIFDIVDSETVGQYTNFSDKNGVKIFEGDICRHMSMIYGDKDVEIGDIIIYHGSWTLRNEYGYIAIGQCSQDSLEVIGNIHDNPSLLNFHNNG